MPQQFENPANIEVHVRTTAQEIVADFPSGLDALITGVGTGGHITGCAQVLKEKWPKLKVFAVEPTRVAGDQRRQAGPHPIQGIGAGFIPKNLHTELLDGVIQVEAEAAQRWRAARRARKACWSASRRARRWRRSRRSCPSRRRARRVLGFNYDTGERYLSIEGFLPVE